MPPMCKLTLTKALGFYTYSCLDVFFVEDCGPVAQLVEQYTFNVRVDGSNPSGLTSFLRRGRFFSGPHRLVAQDTTLSRWLHEFESRWGRHSLFCLSSIKLLHGFLNLYLTVSPSIVGFGARH
jgi:hypothetical protein